MENNGISLELEEMRLQMAALQQQLNEQLKLDEEQLNKSIISKTNSVNGFGTWYLWGGIVSIIAGSIFFYFKFNFSIIFIVITALISLIDAVANYIFTHSVKVADISDRSMSDNINSLIKAKKCIKWQFIISGLVAFLVLLPWAFLYELRQSIEQYYHYDIFNSPMRIVAAFVMCYSLGTLCAVFLYMRIQKRITKIIEMMKH